MAYIRAEDLQFPFTDRMLRKAHPNTSFPAIISDELRASYGVYPVTIADKPSYDEATQTIDEATPQEVNGAWIAGWTIRDKTAEELVADKERIFGEINAERERRIVEGSAFTVDGIADPIPLQGRPFDQTVYLALLTRAGGLKSAGVTAPALTVRDGADTIHELTPDQMIDLVSQAMLWFESVMATSWAMKDGAAPFETGIPADYTADTHWPE